MRKSELYARYDNWNQELIEIDQKEFNEHMTIENERLIDQYEDRGTYVINIKTDGWYYYSYSSSWRVSSDFGDLDSDQFFCKIKIMTWAEIEELAAMLG